MYLDSAKKQELFEKYGKSATNTGSAESQIACSHSVSLTWQSTWKWITKIRYGKIIEDVGR